MKRVDICLPFKDQADLFFKSEEGKYYFGLKYLFFIMIGLRYFFGKIYGLRYLFPKKYSGRDHGANRYQQYILTHVHVDCLDYP